MSGGPLLERFARVVRDAAHRPLVYLPLTGTVITAAQLRERVTGARRVLESLETRPGDLILNAAGNRVEFLSVFLAALELHAGVLPLDAGTAPAEMQEIADRFAARVMVAPDPPSLGERGSNPERIGDVQAVAIARGAAARPYPGAILKLTSGSAGVPRAAVATQDHLVSDGEHVIAAMDVRPGDPQMAAIPLSHSYGLGNLVMPLVLQGTPIVLRDAFVPQRFPADARTYGARVFPGVPFMFDHFSAHLSPGAWPPQLDRLISAGARLERATLRAFHGSFGLKIHSFYGTSETGGIAYDDAPGLPDEPVVGRPMPEVTVTLQPEEGAGEGSGRVHVSSPAIADGYADGAAFETGLAEGGFLTGDLGRFDAHGALVLTGRVSDFINVAGRKVQPEEVEAVLRGMPDVLDVRVVGGADPLRGEQIVACIVAAGMPPDTAAVRRFCAARLAPHKIPRAVVPLERIPVTARGKTDRRQLRAAVDVHLRGARGTGVL